VEASVDERVDARAFRSKRYSTIEAIEAGSLRLIEPILFALALVLLGYVSWVHLESAYVYSHFEREVANLAPRGERAAVPPSGSGSSGSPASPSPRLATTVSMPDSRGFLGVLEVPRLGFSTVIFEGVEEKTLRRAVGHIPGTAFPGGKGNVGIAGHRDRFFRPLRELRSDDLILVHTPHAYYAYNVDSFRVVSPEETAILEGSGKGQLTLVTCYPFFYLGPAPERFVVFARQVKSPMPL
jgi:sortase A